MSIQKIHLQNTSNKNAVAGFTLFEILLVIVVLSFLIVLGVASIRQQSTTKMLDKAAQQTQQWLEAGLAYYLDNKSWPSKMSDMDLYLSYSSTSSGSNLSSMQQNPWGGTYSMQVASDNSTFGIIVTLPSPELAIRLAGLLPNATPLDDPLTLIAVVPKPTMVIPKVTVDGAGTPFTFNTVVTFHGIMQNNDVIPIPNCTDPKYPPGSLPFVTGGISNIPVYYPLLPTAPDGIYYVYVYFNVVAWPQTSASAGSCFGLNQTWPYPMPGNPLTASSESGYGWRLMFYRQGPAGTVYTCTGNAVVTAGCSVPSNIMSADDVQVAPLCHAPGCVPPAGKTSCEIGFAGSGEPCPLPSSGPSGNGAQLY